MSLGQVHYNKTRDGERDITCDTACQESHRQCVRAQKDRGRSGAEKAPAARAQEVCKGTGLFLFIYHYYII